MRAFMSDASARQRAEVVNRGAYNDAAAVYEARAILAVTEPEGQQEWRAAVLNPVRFPRHTACLDCDAGTALAESLAAFVADVPPWDDDPRPFVSESAAPRCRSGRPLRVQRRPPQLALDGTSRPESRPTIRTEGREADGPLFTQDQDARERAEVRSQRRMF